MGSYNWVLPQELVGTWLAAQPHQQEYVDNRKTIGRSSISTTPLGRLCSRLTQGPNPRYERNDVRCLVTRSVYDDQLLLDDCNWVSRSEFDSLRRFVLSRYDVLVTLKGLGACKANIYLSDLEAIHSREVGVVRLKDSALSAYLSAFFRSRYGKLLLRQGTLGTAQITLATSYLRELPVPVPRSEVHRYVGDKVELAEALRSEAVAMDAEARNLFLSAWPVPQVNLTGRFSARAGVAELDGDRLDAEYFRPDLVNLEDLVRRNPHGFVRIGEVADVFSGRTPRERVSEANGVEVVRVANLTGHGLDWGKRQYGLLGKGSRQSLLAGGDIIICKDAHQKYYIGKHVDVYCRPEHAAVASSETLVIRFRDPSPGAFAAREYLRTGAGYAAIQQQIRGTSAHLYPKDVEKIVVPQIPKPAGMRIEELVRQSDRRFIISLRLLHDAIKDVEALIEGTLDTKAILSGQLKPPTEEEVLGA